MDWRCLCSNLSILQKLSIFKEKLHQEVTDHELKLSAFKGNPHQKIKPEKDYALRLRKLENLYKDGLLTTEEYEAKRQDILDEDWGS